jgi:hypothetical protein
MSDNCVALENSVSIKHDFSLHPQACRQGTHG